MSRKQRKLLLRIVAAAVLFAAGIAASYLGAPGYIDFAIFILCYIVIGWDIVFKAWKNIIHGQVFDENFLMSIATIGAVIIGEYSEGAAVMLFYQVGEWFQSYAVSKSRKSISELMDIRPDYANVMRNGSLEKVSPEEVAVGEVIVVRPGEKIPIDGEIIRGSSALDTSALTGESMPRDVSAGMRAVSGCINCTGSIEIRTTTEFGSSTVARILDLVENAAEKKARTESFITRFAAYYTPIVVFAAVALAVIPPLIGMATGGAALWSVWIYRALSFLVTSCPCALVISVPLSFFAGIGGASSCGILIKGSSYLETLARTETVVFDKTGTLTKGSFAVTKLHPVGVSEEKLLELAAYAESLSLHPIASSVTAAYGREIDESRISSSGEVAGHGVRAVIDGHSVLAGNAKLLLKEGVKIHECDEVGTVIYIAMDGDFLGYILIEDEVKEDSARAIESLRSLGVRKTVMLTGDSDSVGRKIADKLGIDEAFTELLPADKVEKVEAMTDRSSKGKLAFVGDGINDAPVLACSDVGIAMGGLGSDAAIEAADVVLMTDEPSKLATAIRIARKTLSIANQNIIFALAVKVAVLVLAAIGIADMKAAVFADVGVTVIAILNAMRALKTKGMA